MKKYTALKVMTTAALVASLAAPFAASAASDNYAATVPAVKSTNSTAFNLGNLVLRETEGTAGSVSAGQTVTITLPSGVSFGKDVTDAFAALDAAEDTDANGVIDSTEAGDVDLTKLFVAGGGLTATDLGYVKGSGNSKSLTVKILDSYVADGTKRAQITFPILVTTDGASGEIKVNVFAPNSGFTNGDVTVATAAGAGTVAAALNAPTISRADNQTIGSIRVTEARGATFVAGDYIDLVLPSDFTFASASVTAVGLELEPALSDAGNYKIDTNGDGYSRLRMKVKGVTTSTPGFVTVIPKVNVDPDASLGDLNVKVKGDDVTSTTVTAAKVADFGVSITAADAPSAYAGRADQDVSKISIAEGIGGSLLDKRTITLELPSYAHWYALPTVDQVKGNATVSEPTATVDNSRRKLSFTITGGTSKSQVDLKDATIFLDADAPAGDVTAKIAGTNGSTGDLVVAKVVAPVSVTADLNKQVKIGVQNQASGNIVIKEAGAGVLKNSLTEVGKSWSKTTTDPQTSIPGEVILKAPTGVKFASVPTVTVDGDLKFVDAGVKLNSDKDELTLPIDKSSTSASTITLSNVAFTVDRTVPEGKITLDVTGSALDYVQDSNGDVKDAIVKADVATVVTPAPGEQKGNAVFTVGQTNYTANGAAGTLDAAPYIKDSRTFVPVRAFAEALGATVGYDQATGTVSILNGGKAVSLVIGSKLMNVGGVPVALDVAPEITNDRTFLPFRAIAEALGATVVWDQNAQTVTIQ